MAITKQDVTSKLAPIIENIPDEGIQNIVVSQEDGATIQINVDAFVSLFGEAADMSAASLLAVDGGTLGYSGYINDWQVKGYIV